MVASSGIIDTSLADTARYRKPPNLSRGGNERRLLTGKRTVNRNGTTDFVAPMHRVRSRIDCARPLFEGRHRTHAFSQKTAVASFARVYTEKLKRNTRVAFKERDAG